LNQGRLVSTRQSSRSIPSPTSGGVRVPREPLWSCRSSQAARTWKAASCCERRSASLGPGDDAELLQRFAVLADLQSRIHVLRVCAWWLFFSRSARALLKIEVGPKMVTTDAWKEPAEATCTVLRRHPWSQNCDPADRPASSLQSARHLCLVSLANAGDSGSMLAQPCHAVPCLVGIS
jgi:hypothetical protein